ncbi:MAG TPA: endonuclease domain-containing protein [Methylomirabilota bacterium]|jgi:adenine-specific DNA-methyltransferase|nr:endonuclease domain-containing protein [Methylomirabilota bacterium]
MQDQAFARNLRKQSTPEEKILWFLLQGRRFGNFKFRRQVAIDQYIVDFCCLKKRLVIELDGGTHNSDSQKLKDKIRQDYLEKSGFKVLRFWNDDITNHLSIVKEKIFNALFNPSSVRRSRTSSPARGEEE